MRTTVFLPTLIITVACTMVAQRRLLQGDSAGRADYQNISYRTIAASDGTYTVQLPVDWLPRNAQLQSTLAQSGRGESVGWGTISVIDVIHFQAYRRILGQFAGYASQVFPVVADPMPPEGVLLNLYPRLYRGVQNIRILGIRPVASSTALIFYQYSPSNSATPVRGGALIVTAPPQTDNFGIWTIAYWKTEAPAPLFDRDLPIFGNILSSLHYDIDRIFAMEAANQQAMSRTTGNIIHGEAQEYQRRSQMITQNGQIMLAMQTQLGQTFQSQDQINGQNRIAALGGYAPFRDSTGDPLYAPLGSKSVNTSTLGPPRFSSQEASSLGPGWRAITQVY